MQSVDIISSVGAPCAVLGQADSEYESLSPLLAAAEDNIFL